LADDLIDTNGSIEHYKFDYVHREFLGEVRCLFSTFTPLAKAARELRRTHLAGTRLQRRSLQRFVQRRGHSSWYFNFDSWRTNVQPGNGCQFIYSEKRSSLCAEQEARLKAQTRIWGYNSAIRRRNKNSARSCRKARNDENHHCERPEPDPGAALVDASEDNVVDRLQRIGLIAPKAKSTKCWKRL